MRKLSILCSKHCTTMAKKYHIYFIRRKIVIYLFICYLWSPTPWNAMKWGTDREKEPLRRYNKIKHSAHTLNAFKTSFIIVSISNSRLSQSQRHPFLFLLLQCRFSWLFNIKYCTSTVYTQNLNFIYILRCLFVH